MKVFVVGAGLAGLSAAVDLARAGVAVELSDAANLAGGRCRSYFDPQLGTMIDNGNHLVMSGNQAVHDYLRAIGGAGALSGPDEAVFDFVDLATRERWRLRPNLGPLPWWVLAPQRRTPGSRVLDYLAMAGLIRPRAGARVGEAIPAAGPVWERLMEPFLLAALNTAPAGASARLAAAVVRETLVKGGKAYRPRIPTPNLATALVDPAVAFIQANGGVVKLGRRLTTIGFDEGRVAGLQFSDGETRIGQEDRVILAVPPWIAGTLIPSLSRPDDFRAIVNGHFLIQPPAEAPAMIGVLNGSVQWIFAFKDRVSITVSAADDLVDLDRQVLAERLWAEAAQVLGLPAQLPPWQIVKEKRATFAATVEQDRLRPDAQTDWPNLLLAGDWIQTGLPATIEGAVRSGVTAAGLALRPHLG